jgi:hypothetical protein
MTGLLGGEFSPIGWSVHYLQAAPDAVIADIIVLRAGSRIEVRAAEPYPAVLERLAPFEAPWTRELVMPCGSWSAYLNNGIDGGDSTAVAQAVARRLGVRHVMAEHTLRYGPGHQATQLWISGPQGEPPLMDERAISATASDGRWEWYTSGEPLPFEDVGRYASRKIRERFDRPLLLAYLDALGIPAEDDAAYGDGVLVQEIVDWPVRAVSLAEARAALQS